MDKEWEVCVCSNESALSDGDTLTTFVCVYTNESALSGIGIVITLSYFCLLCHARAMLFAYTITIHELVCNGLFY